MKKIVLMAMLVPSLVLAKNLQDCGAITIEQIITGPRHGSLLNTDDNSCGHSGYVCIDLEGEYSSKEKGQAAYAFALASKMANQEVNVTVDLDFKPLSCNGFPVVEDLRSK